MTSGTHNTPWSISSYVTGVVFNLLSGFLACISGSTEWLNDYLNLNVLSLSAPSHGLSQTVVHHNSNNCNTGSVFVPKWIWLFTCMTIISLLQVGLAEGTVTSPTQSGRGHLFFFTRWGRERQRSLFDAHDVQVTHDVKCS